MNQHESPRKVSDLAAAFGVDANTIRQWCRRYAQYLSAGAKPPSGGTRLFSARDFSVLSYVHAALNSGMNHAEIGMKMAEISFNDGESDVIVGLPEVLPPESPPDQGDSPQDHLDSPSPAHEGIEAVLNEIVSLRQELAKERARQGSRTDDFVSGMIFGLFCVVIALALWSYYAP